jgi:hypothetical protein
MEIQYSQLKINHLNDTPSTKAAGSKIFSGVFQQGRQGTSQGQEDFELSWYLFFQQGVISMVSNNWNLFAACLSGLRLLMQDTVRPSKKENISRRNKKMEGTNGPYIL